MKSSKVMDRGEHQTLGENIWNLPHEFATAAYSYLKTRFGAVSSSMVVVGSHSAYSLGKRPINTRHFTVFWERSYERPKQGTCRVSGRSLRPNATTCIKRKPTSDHSFAPRAMKSREYFAPAK
jgi:hypothetical protein